MGGLALSLLVLGLSIPLADGSLQLATIGFVSLIPVFMPVVRANPTLTRIWVAGATWSLAQIASDIYHTSTIVSKLALVGPVIAVLCTGLLWIQERFKLTLASIAFAFSLGWLLLELFVGEALASENPWKYGLAVPVIATVLATVDRMRPAIQLMALGLLALVSLVTDSRLYLGLCLGTAALLLLLRRTQALRAPRRALLIGTVLAVLGFVAYPSLALSGALGERARSQQVIFEASGTNFLASNRPEAFQALYLITEHPVLGIGSNARLDSSEAYAAISFASRFTGSLQGREYYLLGIDQQSQGYRAHSSALDSAVSAGVLALPFWALLVVVLTRGLRALRVNEPMAASLIFFSALFVWNALFSPLSARAHLPIVAVLFLLLGKSAELVPNNSSKFLSFEDT